VDAAAAAARFVALAGAAWLFGLVPVTRIVLAAVPSSVPGTAWAHGRQRLMRRITRSVDAAAVAALAGTAGVLWLQQGELVRSGLAADRGEAVRLQVDTVFGQLTALRVVVVVGLWLAIRPGLPERALPAHPPRPSDRLYVATWGVLAGGLLLTFPLTGHAAATTEPALTVTVDAAHLLAAAVWLTGIGTLGMVLPEVLARQRERVRLSVLASALTRFAALAVGAVTVIVVTGGFSAVLALGGLEPLRSSAYGQALVVKLWLVAWVLAVGGVNHFFLVPRLARAAEGGGRDRGSAPEGALALSVGAELVLGILIVASTAVLIGLPRPA